MHGFGVISQRTNEIPAVNYAVSVKQEIKPNLYIKMPKGAVSKRSNQCHVIDRRPKHIRNQESSVHSYSEKGDESMVINKKSTRFSPLDNGEQDPNKNDEENRSEVSNKEQGEKEKIQLKASNYSKRETNNKRKTRNYPINMISDEDIIPQKVGLEDSEEEIDEYRGQRVARKSQYQEEIEAEHLVLSEQESILRESKKDSQVLKRNLKLAEPDNSYRMTLALSSDESNISQHSIHKMKRNYIEREANSEVMEIMALLSVDESNLSQHEIHKTKRIMIEQQSIDSSSSSIRVEGPADLSADSSYLSQQEKKQMKRNYVPEQPYHETLSLSNDESNLSQHIKQPLNRSMKRQEPYHQAIDISNDESNLSEHDKKGLKRSHKLKGQALEKYHEAIDLSNDESDLSEHATKKLKRNLVKESSLQSYHQTISISNDQSNISQHSKKLLKRNVKKEQPDNYHESISILNDSSNISEHEKRMLKRNYRKEEPYHQAINISNDESNMSQHDSHQKRALARKQMQDTEAVEKQKLKISLDEDEEQKEENRFKPFQSRKLHDSSRLREPIQRERYEISSQEERMSDSKRLSNIRHFKKESDQQEELSDYSEVSICRFEPLTLEKISGDDDGSVQGRVMSNRNSSSHHSSYSSSLDLSRFDPMKF